MNTKNKFPKIILIIHYNIFINNLIHNINNNNNFCHNIISKNIIKVTKMIF